MRDEDGTTSLWAVAPRPSLETRVSVLLGSGPSMPATTVLSAGALVIGRAPEAQIRVRERGVSRAHARIITGVDDSVTLIDLESSNGTFVNASRIELVLLQDGDQIQLGPTATFRYVRRAPGELALARHRLTIGRAAILTAREREIAFHVAEGRTNAEIATLLGIKIRTVVTHLEHAFAKLQIGSRVELTRVVLDLDRHAAADELTVARPAHRR